MQGLRVWLFGMLMLCSLACVAATPAKQAPSPLASLLKAQAIDSSYAVNYRDEHGKPMTEAAFSTSFTHGRSFRLERDAATHSATLTLRAKGAKFKLSDKEIAAIKATPPGKNWLKPGQAVPPFHLASTDGHSVDNTALKGHRTLINFYFAECAPCIAETPALIAYAKQYPHRHVLAVTFDDAKVTRKYMADHGLNWPVLVDGMGFDQSMGVDTYPTMALVGPDGKILKMALSSQIAGGKDIPTVTDLAQWVDAPVVAGKPR